MQQQEGESCQTIGVKFTVRVLRRRADIIYYMPSGAFNRIEKVYNDETVETVNPEDYLSVLDVLYPPYGSEEWTSIQNWLLFYTTRQVSKHSEVPGKMIEIYLLPFIIQQWSFPSASEYQVNATFCKERNKILVSLGSMQVFSVFGSVILIWSLTLLAVSSRRRRPEVSSFPDMDLMSSISVDQGRENISELARQMREIKSRDIENVLGGIYLRTSNPQDIELSWLRR